MEVILIDQVSNLGDIGDQVNVKAGYARNYLLPQKLAISASTKNAKRLAHERRYAEVKAAAARAEDEAVVARLADVSVTIARKSGEQDKLYGSVTTIDIEQALAEEGIAVDRRKLELAEPIKTVGVYEIPVKLRSNLTAKVKVWVVAE